MKQLHAGDVIAGRFEILHLVGRGGMGSVYRARDRESGEPVAIKVQAHKDERQARRGARESMLLAAVSSPGIVRYHAHGKTLAGELYLAMEWLDGEDLATRLDRDGVTIAESLRIAAQVAASLATVHAQGIAHRDVKPSNIFLVDGDVGRVKLIDFGIARIGGVTRSRTLMGTPGYVAPEQARGDGTVDGRADVFALGCVLFECLVGRPPYQHPNELAVLELHRSAPVPEVAALVPGVPAGLAAAITRALGKAPSDRWNSATEMRAVLGP